MRRFFGIMVLVIAASASAVGQADNNGGACIDSNGNCQPVAGVPEVAGDTAMAAFALLSGGIAILRARRKG